MIQAQCNNLVTNFELIFSRLTVLHFLLRAVMGNWRKAAASQRQALTVFIVPRGKATVTIQIACPWPYSGDRNPANFTVDLVYIRLTCKFSMPSLAVLCMCVDKRPPVGPIYVVPQEQVVKYTENEPAQSCDSSFERGDIASWDAN